MNLSDTFVIFELDRAAYAIQSADVQHIAMVEHITAVPNTLPAVDGVVFARGEVVPVINLRARFGLARQPQTPASRLIFLKVKQRAVALHVDAAREFRRIPAESVQPIQETLVGIQGNYIQGVATIKDRSVFILDLAAVLTVEEITPPVVRLDAGKSSV